MMIDETTRRTLVAAAMLAVAGLSPPALAAPDAGQACQSLYQRANRDHCRAQLAQNQWPCSGMPVQDLQDLKTCAQIFDFNSFPSAAAGTQPRSPVDLKAMTLAPQAQATLETSPAPAREQSAEVVPLRMIDLDIASKEAAQKASVERQRALEQERTRLAARLGVDPQVHDVRPPAAPDGQVVQLYAELQRMQAESDRLAAEISIQTEALEAARRQRAALETKEAPKETGEANGRALGAALLAVGALILAALIGGILFWRRRQAGGGDATRVFVPATESGGTITGSRPFKDCTLESREGPALLLVGSLLPESAGGIVVGRHAAQAQVIIDSPEVSRRHARFSVRDGALAVEDLGSANGTSVDGKPVRAGERRIVGHGARIQFGPLTYTLRLAS